MVEKSPMRIYISQNYPSKNLYTNSVSDFKGLGYFQAELLGPGTTSAATHGLACDDCCRASYRRHAAPACRACVSPSRWRLWSVYSLKTRMGRTHTRQRFPHHPRAPSAETDVRARLRKKVLRRGERFATTKTASCARPASRWQTAHRH